MIIFIEIYLHIRIFIEIGSKIHAYNAKYKIQLPSKEKEVDSQDQFLSLV